MCGIYCALSKGHFAHPSVRMQQLLKARGPDAANIVDVLSGEEIRLNHSELLSWSITHVSCYSTVLSLRGQVVTSQPHQSQDGTTVLCWNGEAWNVKTSPAAESDTVVIHNILRSVERVDGRSEGQGDRTGLAEVTKAMSKIAGPYAFVFVDKKHGKVYFGRDFLGRRSLLWSKSRDETGLLLSSVADPDLESDWVEVEAGGVYCINLNPASAETPSDDQSVEYWGNIRVTKAQFVTPTKLSKRDQDYVVPTISLNRQTPATNMALHENSSSVAQLQQLLRDSLTPRILKIPVPPERVGPHYKLGKSSLAILFSGGLDCTVLARISHDLLPLSEPIDLLNVAFENPRIHKPTAKDSPSEDFYELCPDRITGRASYDELRSVCSGRDWRFVAINVPYAETQGHRRKIITLMHPHNTEMDLSISLAFYFAARGTGTLSQESSGDDLPYTTAARVLISGLGADELFAGYGRHASAFDKNGFDGLLDELDLDIGRLGKRNLGRDDRIISNWAREARFPFLDEELVRWALAQPVSEKCGFGRYDEPSGDLGQDLPHPLEPGKQVLRCLALKLGMRKVAREKKRAIQFGARTAKMETGNTKGTHVLSNS